MNRFLKGAVAGALATIPMTVVMVQLHRRLPRRQRYPLPPAEITAELARRTRTTALLAGDKLTGATLTAHLAYGALVGAFYPAVAVWLRLPPKNQRVGAAYGVGIWALSYLGWIPALRILRPATQHPAPRNALMIWAHMVWGSALAWFSARLKSKNTRRNKRRAQDR